MKKCDIIFFSPFNTAPIVSVVSSSMTVAALPDLVWGMRYNPWCGWCFSFYLKNKSILTEIKIGTYIISHLVHIVPHFWLLVAGQGRRRCQIQPVSQNSWVFYDGSRNAIIGGASMCNQWGKTYGTMIPVCRTREIFRCDREAFTLFASCKFWYLKFHTPLLKALSIAKKIGLSDFQTFRVGFYKLLASAGVWFYNFCPGRSTSWPEQFQLEFYTNPWKSGNRILILNDGHCNFIHIVIGM
jgi:hypothetical protein